MFKEVHSSQLIIYSVPGNTCYFKSCKWCTSNRYRAEFFPLCSVIYGPARRLSAQEEVQQVFWFQKNEKVSLVSPATSETVDVLLASSRVVNLYSRAAL